MTAAQPTVSVVVITYSRPDYVETCLDHLRALATPVEQVILVDSSPDRESADLVESRYPEVEYVRSGLARGTMPEARSMGLELATGDIVAFIDDDAFVFPRWRDELVRPYADARVAAVGGRAINGAPGEAVFGLGDIGRLLPNGSLTGNFPAVPGRVIAVDHLIGANMSFRRDALAEIGGIHGYYPGTCVREESDISLRLGAAGYRLVFAPQAVVHHVGAPYRIGGQRFDRRYLFYSQHNHVMLLARVYGFGSPYLRRYLWTALRGQVVFARQFVRILSGRPDERGLRPTARQRAIALAGVVSRVAAEWAGLAAGWAGAVRGRALDRRHGSAVMMPTGTVGEQHLALELGPSA